MTTRSQPRIISLSAELARPDNDDRHRLAQRWQAALHRLCLLRATANETSYEVEWARIFDHDQLMADMWLPLKLLAFAALDVLDVQRAHGLVVCDMEGIAYNQDAAEEFPELIAAMRIRIANRMA